MTDMSDWTLERIAQARGRKIEEIAHELGLSLPEAKLIRREQRERLGLPPARETYTVEERNAWASAETEEELLELARVYGLTRDQAMVVRRAQRRYLGMPSLQPQREWTPRDLAELMKLEGADDIREWAKGNDVNFRTAYSRWAYERQRRGLAEAPAPWTDDDIRELARQTSAEDAKAFAESRGHAASTGRLYWYEIRSGAREVPN